MDPKLADAARRGNVEFLREFVGENYSQLEAEANAIKKGNTDYSNTSLLCAYIPTDQYLDGNILHLAVKNEREEFLKEALQILPDSLVHLLLSLPDNSESLSNPLHLAAIGNHIGIVRLIMSFYKSVDFELHVKPWLALDSSRHSWGLTPFHLALSNEKEDCGLEILKSVDVGDLEALCNMVNQEGNSPLYLAVKNGWSRLALQILTSAPSYSVRSEYGYTPLQFVCNCNEEVFKLMVERHPEFITADVKGIKGYTLLHEWAEEGKLWPLEYVFKSKDMLIAPELKSHLVHFMYDGDWEGNTPFHIAAMDCDAENARILANIYKEEREKELASSEASTTQHDHFLPWLQPNKKGRTPLEFSLNESTTASEKFNHLKRDIVEMKSTAESECGYLFLAIQKGLFHAAEAIWFTTCNYGWWSKYPPQGQEMWEVALNCTEEVAIWVADKLHSLTSETTEIERTLLFASEAGFTRLITRTLKKHPSALKLAPLAWVKACQKGHFTTIMAFIDNCPYFREICLEKKDTPLHHIKFDGYKQYQSFFKDPIVLGWKNFQDCNGDTPLHKSIRNRDLLLTEVLLTTDDVIRSIEDNKHKTAMDLLVKECRGSREWDEMCIRNGIIPGLQTTYFQDKTNLLEVRNTLSVVAALLATITFTAGFTLPGGVKSDNTGKATLGNKAAFLVFLLADALAMCCSMLVLVCLIWSMLCDHNRSLLLIDRSMPVLLLALYSTLVAFMTGVYVVIPHSSLWAAIVILIMCSIFIISSKRTIMYKLLDKLNPYMDRKYNDDENRLLEQGEARSSQNGKIEWKQERACTNVRYGSFQQLGLEPSSSQNVSTTLQIAIDKIGIDD